jgi:hypothetical protein
MRPIQFTLALLLAFVVLSPPTVVAESEREKERDREEAKLWESLGTRTVDFKNAKDVFDVGRKEGRFTHLRFKVDSGEIFLDEIEVTYGDGKTWKHKVDHEFKESSRSHDIELGEGAHVIRKVEVTYHKLKHSEPVTIELLGKVAR